MNSIIDILAYLDTHFVAVYALLMLAVFCIAWAAS